MRDASIKFYVVAALLVAACGGSSTLDGSDGGGSGSANAAGNGPSGSGDPGAAGNDSDASGLGTTGAGTSSGSDGTGTTAGTGSSSSSAGHDGTPVASTRPADPARACTDQSYDAKVTSLDMFIVQDRSGSMKDPVRKGGPSKWSTITTALSEFLSDPRSAGIGAGISFFGITDSADPDDDTISCDVDLYAQPSVPIAPLTGNAPSIIEAIKARKPGGGTPTPAALEGGLRYAKAWAAEHPTHRVVLVLATDGLPNRCPGSGSGADPASLAATLPIAEDGVAASIPTYVIGVMAASNVKSFENLNQIAEAGGTGSAFIVDTDGNAEALFSNAMSAIREANRLSCELPIPAPPAGQWIDYQRVSVLYSSGTNASEAFGWVGGASSCSAAGGFYYDNNVAPTRIHLCKSTCDRVEADTAASLKILFECMLPTDGGTGAGGGGGGGVGGGGPRTDGGRTCLLDGQSCKTGADCCSGYCNGYGACGAVLK